MDKSFQSWWRLIARIVMFGGLLWLLFFVTANPLRARLAVQDWWRLQNYEPTVEMQEISQQLLLTDEGKRIFYASQPQLLDKETFNNYCQTREKTNILGCYTGSSDIYLLDVDQPEIEHVEEVTAAHELLHGAWARLPTSEKQRLGDLLQGTFNQLNDERLNDIINRYKEANTDDDTVLVRNELHSILATEVASLPDELEEHYATYFNDRQAVVNLYNDYASEFEERQERIDEIQQKLQDLKQRIESLNSKFEQLTAENDQLVERIQRLRNQGRTEESNQLVPQQNQVVREINQTADTINQLISQHNALVQENNQLALQLSQFSESLDTKSYNTQ